MAKFVETSNFIIVSEVKNNWEKSAIHYTNTFFSTPSNFMTVTLAIPFENEHMLSNGFTDSKNDEYIQYS